MYSSIEDSKDEIKEEGITDIILTVEEEASSGPVRYAACFISYQYIATLIGRKEESSHEQGLYYFAPNLILSRQIDKNTLVRVIGELIAEGDFYTAFRKL